MLNGRVLIFLVIVSLVVLLTHRYLYVRLVRDPAWGAGAIRWGRRALWAAGGGMLLALALMRFVPRWIATLLAWPAFVWMGVVLIVGVLLVVSDLLTGRIVARRPDRVDPARRLALARGAAVVSSVGAAGVSGLGIYTAALEPELLQLEVPIERLPPAFDGLRVVHLSDLHVGPTLGRPFVQRIVDRVNALAPDLVAITGDLIDGSVRRLGDQIEPLGALRSRFGTFFVTGNHEYYSGARAWIAALERLGVRVLENERERIEVAGAGLDLIGVNDLQAAGFGAAPCDVAGACEGRDVEQVGILLAHQPKVIHQVAGLGIDLQLSGHNHGGQIWPIEHIHRLIQTYVVGLHRHDARTWIYVSPGTGYWGPPMRVGTRSAITLLRLRAPGGPA